MKKDIEHSREAARRRTVKHIEEVSPWSKRRVVGEYFDWLETVRYLASSTVYTLVLSASRRILPSLLDSETACVRSIRKLVPADVGRLLERLRHGAGPAARRQLAYSVSQLLQFWVSRGWIDARFLGEVPTLTVTVRRPFWTPEAPRARTARAIAAVRSRSARRVLRDYAEWLEDARGLALSTIEHRLKTARRLFGYWLGHDGACARRLRQLTVDDVESAFVRRRREGAGHQAQRTFQAGLRSFLRFCATRKWVASDLADAVPSIRTYRLSTVPRAVSEADLPGLFAAIGLRSRAPLRDRAILLVLATYGVRRAQVADLQLGDLDWHQRRVVFRAHKGGRTVRHELTPAVAGALGAYLRERPECEVPHVFLRVSERKKVGISPVMVTYVVKQLFETAEIQSRPQGPHALRHAFAKRILAAGNSLATVSDLLGHRALDSTAVYAKVDTGRLREAPLEWPEVLR